MPQNDLLIQSIFDNTDTTFLQKPDLHAALAVYINDLILQNFDELVYILYRVDVSEKKLKALLKENAASDAGYIISTLIIERQLKKVKSRRESRRDNNIIDDNDIW